MNRENSESSPYILYVPHPLHPPFISRFPSFLPNYLAKSTLISLGKLGEI